MGVVPTMQLLLRPDGEGKKDLVAVDNPAGQTPADFEHSGQGAAPRLGTTDLILFADALRNLGYRPVHFELRDSRFRELPPEDDEEIEGRLLTEVREHDGRSALHFLAGSARGVYVIEFEVRTPKGRRISLDRNGILSGNPAEVESFLQAVRAAWPGDSLA
jgi:hypothetical protein